MFIQTAETPNPATMKFIPGREVMGDAGTAFYTNKEAAIRSPLALALFEENGVRAIFLGQDFITVTKQDDVDWEVMKPMMLTAMMDHFVAGKPVIEQQKTTENEPKPSSSNGDLDELSKQIVELIDTRVRPAVAMDGGDIVFHSFEDGVVRLEMHGACSGCPSSTITLKQGIENMLKHYIPEVTGVEAV